MATAQATGAAGNAQAFAQPQISGGTITSLTAIANSPVQSSVTTKSGAALAVSSINPTLANASGLQSAAFATGFAG